MCKKRKIYTMSELSAAMMAAFNKINADWFGGELEKVIITFEEGYKKGAYGWICTSKDWKQNGTERYHINISSDYLDRSVYDVLSTLVHEMCHLYNLQQGIQDTSRSNIYHNKIFKDTAEAHGLNCEHIDKAGWARTSCTDKLKLWIDENITFNSFHVYKQRTDNTDKHTKPKQSSRKYVCPCCGLIVRATKEAHISCIDCNEEMLLEL